MKIAFGHVSCHGQVCYRSRSAKNGHTGHRGRKHEGWTEDVTMASGHVLGHGNVCYRSREAENGHTGHRERKREGWTEDMKMASGYVFGHGNVWVTVRPKTATPATGDENVRDGLKT